MKRLKFLHVLIVINSYFNEPKRTALNRTQPYPNFNIFEHLFFREYFRLYLDAKKSDAVVFVHRITTRKKVDAKMRAKIAFECESH